jgi:hypothetical protein
MDATMAFVQAFVYGSPGLLYSNSILSGVASVHLRQLQSVLSAAACLAVQKYDHITKTLCDDLHWFPIIQLD